MSYKLFRSFDIRPECRNITVPLMPIRGLNDEYCRVLQLNEFALAASHTRQLILADWGHSPQRDQLEKTMVAITDILEDIYLRPIISPLLFF